MFVQAIHIESNGIHSRASWKKKTSRSTRHICQRGAGDYKEVLTIPKALPPSRGCRIAHRAFRPYPGLLWPTARALPTTQRPGVTDIDPGKEQCRHARMKQLGQTTHQDLKHRFEKKAYLECNPSQLLLELEFFSLATVENHCVSKSLKLVECRPFEGLQQSSMDESQVMLFEIVS